MHGFVCGVDLRAVLVENNGKRVVGVVLSNLLLFIASAVPILHVQ